MQLKNKIVIAVDGHSSCGKSTMAKSLAKELGYIYIDSGAMYRAVTLYAIENKIITGDIVDLEVLKSKIDEIHISFRTNTETGKNETMLNGRIVEDEIRNFMVSDKVSIISKIAFVRQRMVHLQQEMGKNKGVVMDGRDIGTVVFPDAELKIFMTANPDVRTMRRFKELSEKGENVTFDEIKDNLIKRDYLDETRSESPLRKADGAFVLDNSNLSQAEQLNVIIELIKNKFF